MKLDKKSIKILRCLSKRGSLDDLSLIIFTSYELKDIDERIDFLLDKKLIKVDTSNSHPPSLGGDIFKLDQNGEAFLQNHTLKMLFLIIPIVLTAITAIASVLALFI